MLSKSRDFSVFRRQNPGQKFGKMKAKSSQQITKLDDITVRFDIQYRRDIYEPLNSTSGEG